MKQPSSHKIRLLLESETPVLTTQALGGLWGVKPTSAKTLVSRLVTRGILQRLRRNLYVLTGTRVQPFELANALYQPSYLSLETALNYWGMIVQAPQVILSVADHPRRFHLQGLEFVYRQIPRKLLDFGWQKEGQVFIASPEKALLDSLYLESRGLTQLFPRDLMMDKLDRSKLQGWLALYPQGVSQRWQQLAKERYEGTR